MMKPTPLDRPVLAGWLLALLLVAGSAGAKTFRKVPGSAVLLKIVAAAEGVAATTPAVGGCGVCGEKGGEDEQGP